MENVQQARIGYGLSVLLAAVAALGVCTGCGGGGSGDDFIGAANVSISVSPNKIDTGDRAQVAVDIDRVHPNGISLKLRFPLGVEYVNDSTVLSVGAEQHTSLNPTTIVDTGDAVYIVYYLPQILFGEKGEMPGLLTLEFEARAIVRNGQIEVDADVDNPNIDNATEFDPDNPEFADEDYANFEVTG